MTPDTAIAKDCLRLHLVSELSEPNFRMVHTRAADHTVSETAENIGQMALVSAGSSVDAAVVVSGQT